MGRKRRPKYCKATGKIQLTTPNHAIQALLGGAGAKGSIRYYPCKFCNTYHTTSQPYRKRDELNAKQGTDSTAR